MKCVILDQQASDRHEKHSNAFSYSVAAWMIVDASHRLLHQRPSFDAVFAGGFKELQSQSTEKWNKIEFLSDTRSRSAANDKFQLWIAENMMEPIKTLHSKNDIRSPLNFPINSEWTCKWKNWSSLKLLHHHRYRLEAIRVCEDTNSQTLGRRVSLRRKSPELAAANGTSSRFVSTQKSCNKILNLFLQSWHERLA